MGKKVTFGVLLFSVLVLTLSLGLACASSDTNPPSIGEVDENEVSAVGATITWATDEKASSQVEYGISEAYGSKSDLVLDLVKNHAVELENLTPSTTYYYKVVSVDRAGNTADSSGWSFNTRMQFTITGSQVVSANGTATLRIQFTTSAPVSLSLTNPDGLETATDAVDMDATAADLAMADQYVTPKAGKYTLVVENALEPLATREFDFSGANPSITEVTPSFVIFGQTNLYLLQRLTVTLKNTGDLPACIDSGEFTLDGGNVFTFDTSQIVLPGETKTFSVSTSVSGVTGGAKQLSLTLRDSADTVVATFTATVYPSY